jgi:hypothetical protein
VPAENCGLPAEAENFSGAERQKQAGPENGCLCGASLRPAKKLKGTACREKRKIAAVFLLTGAAVLKKICRAWTFRTGRGKFLPENLQRLINSAVVPLCRTAQKNPASRQRAVFGLLRFFY